MIAVLQRIRSCSVTADGEPYSECGAGLLVLLGVSKDDGEEDAKLLCEKISVLRIFCDGDDKMNLSVNDIGGSVMIVPNFTLLRIKRESGRTLCTAPAPRRQKSFSTFSVTLWKSLFRTCAAENSARICRSLL